MLDSLFSKTSPPSYSRLKTSSSQESLQTLPTPTSTSPSSPSLTPRIASRIVQLCKLVIFPLIFTSLGIIIGLTLSRHGSSISTAVNLNIHPNLFTYNPLFGSKPSNESDEAWEELFPKRGGFFNHPVIAPKRSAYAVFHQLHCLNAIRTAYWTTLHHATSPKSSPLDVSTIPFEISPPHMRHCIDLLRQALMCVPDLTVEIKNETLGGVTGFGTVHQCRDWSQLMGWMEEWQDVGAPKHAPMGHQHGHGHAGGEGGGHEGHNG